MDKGEVKPAVKISSLIEDLANGLTRVDIGKKYNMDKKEVDHHFKNPQLKGRKTAKIVLKYVLVDDVSEAQLKEETFKEGEQEKAIDDLQRGSEEEEKIKNQADYFRRD